MIIAVTNRKGGVGKTTVSTHLAAGLAIIGYNVGLVETDSQSHVAASLGLEQTDDLYELMVHKDAVLGDHVQRIMPEQYSLPDHPAKGNLYIISGAEQTYRIAAEVNQQDTFAFLRLMDEWQRTYQLDYIIVDTSPTLKALDSLINLAIDGYIYVTEASKLAIDGLYKAIEQFDVAFENRRRYLNLDTRILGIVPNKVRFKTAAHRVILNEIKDAYPQWLWRPLGLRINWEDASLHNEPVFKYAPTSAAAQDAWHVIRQFMKVIQAWEQETNRKS